jgi:predicted aspartyl protease
MIVILVALTLVTIGTVWALVVYQSIFKTPTDVTTILSSWFTVVGTLVGAYFGVKASTDATSAAQSTIQSTNSAAQNTIQSANYVASQAMGAVDPSRAGGIVPPPSPGSPQ